VLVKKTPATNFSLQPAKFQSHPMQDVSILTQFFQPAVQRQLASLVMRQLAYWQTPADSAADEPEHDSKISC